MPTLSETASALAGEADPPPGLCVLVVEDDEADAYLINSALSRQPTVGKIVHAQDGVEALRMVEDGEVAPDLAFIDLHMPRKDGFGLLAAFAGRAAPSFPMVVLTSSTAPSDAIRSRLRGALRVVCKPDTVEGLEGVLKSAIAAVCPGGPRSGSAGPVAARPISTKIAGFPGIRAAAIDEFGER
jgi:CheY-like chemotaxis protein